MSDIDLTSGYNRLVLTWDIDAGPPETRAAGAPRGGTDLPDEAVVQLLSLGGKLRGDGPGFACWIISRSYLGDAVQGTTELLEDSWSWPYTSIAVQRSSAHEYEHANALSDRYRAVTNSTGGR